MAWKPFSKRKRQLSTELTYEISQEVRARLIHLLKQSCDSRFGSTLDFPSILEAVGKELLVHYGGFERRGTHDSAVSDNPIVQHFFSCSDELTLDYLEIFFRHSRQEHGSESEIVEKVNEILREEGIGYEFTRYVVTESERTDNRFGRNVKILDIQYPLAIEKSNELAHAEIIAPSLSFLRSPKFKVANEEMLKAHGAYRNGEYENAITLCGSAFESVLKTICTDKGWAYNSNDTASALIKVCKDNSLFPSFYAPIFECVGSIRNKISSSHGRGPTPAFMVSRPDAEHHFNLTASHILFLSRLSGL